MKKFLYGMVSRTCGRDTAEIILGRRSVLEYLISPVQKTVFEAGRER